MEDGAGAALSAASLGPLEIDLELVSGARAETPQRQLEVESLRPPRLRSSRLAAEGNAAICATLAIPHVSSRAARRCKTTVES